MNKYETQDALNTQTLGQAICDHLKLDAGRVASNYTLTHTECMTSVNLTVFLTAEDMASVMRKAGAKTGHPPERPAIVSEPGPELINFHSPSKLYGSALPEPRALTKLENAFEDVFGEIFREPLNPKTEPAKPDAPAPDPWMNELLTELKALRASVEKFNQEAQDFARSEMKRPTNLLADGLPPTPTTSGDA